MIFGTNCHLVGILLQVVFYPYCWIPPGILHICCIFLMCGYMSTCLGVMCLYMCYAMGIVHIHPTAGYLEWVKVLSLET
jgi:hypothetical protein